jgi:type I restriction enzyme, S subunit
MNNTNENKLVPKLRFPQFEYEGEWELMHIGDILNAESSALALNRLELKQSGYAVYGADSIIGYIDSFQHKDRYISIVKDGSGVGRLHLCDGETSTLGTLSTLKSKDEQKYKLVWAFYLLNTIDFSTNVKGSGIPHIYFSDYKSEKIGVPKPEEQQKIASCLSSLDGVITAESQKLDVLKEHKKGLLQSLFPQRGETAPKMRFKEFVGDWKTVQFGSLIEIKGRIGYRGYTTNDIVEKGQGAISFSPSNIDDNNRLNFDKATYISWDKYYESPEIMLQDGFTVLVKTGSSFGKAVFIKDLPEKTTINPQLVVLKPTNINPKFLFLLVCNSEIQRQIKETVVGGAIPTLSQENISRFDILVPPDKNKKEQEKIAETLSSIDEWINAQNQNVEALKLQKKGLLQSLFPQVNNTTK